MLIKEDNTPCISCIEASVDLQHGEIICLTDASVTWLQRHKDNIVPKRAICMKEDNAKKVHHCISRSSLARSQKSVCVY
jgi:hypothetical protein